MRKPVKIGIGGPVGSGKTALVDRLCKAMRDRYQIAVITNDIFTKEDMEFLVRSGALPSDRIVDAVLLPQDQNSARPDSRQICSH